MTTYHETAEEYRMRKGEVDKCAQCGMPVKDSYTGRDDLLCEYHAGE